MNGAPMPIRARKNLDCERRFEIISQIAAELQTQGLHELVIPFRRDSAEFDDYDRYFELQFARVFEVTATLSAWFWADTQGVERITFGGVWPRKDGEPTSAYSRYWDGPAPKATVSAARSPKAIAGALRRKLLPEVALITKNIRTRIEREKQETSAKEARLAAVAALLPNPRRVGAWELHFDGGRVTLTPGSGTIALVVEKLSVEQVARILKAIEGDPR